MPNPGWHHGVFARHRDPGERVSERPAGSPRFRDRQLDLVGAGPARENLSDRALRLRGARPWRIPCQPEDRFKSLRLLARSCEPVEGRQQFGVVSCEFLELRELVSQNGEDEPGIEFRVAGPPGLEPPVLVVLDQAVIRVAGEGERIEPERVERGLRQDAQVCPCISQMGQIVVDHVVAENELRAGGIVFQREQPALEAAAVVFAGVGGGRTNGREATNPAGVRIDFEVDRDASRKKLLRPHWFSRILSVQEVASDMRMPSKAIRNLLKVYRLKNIGRNAVSNAFEAKRAELLTEDLTDAEDPEECLAENIL